MAKKQRRVLSPEERGIIFDKTGGRCHVCGCVIHGDWQADHIEPHAAGGADSIDNYLPACTECNRLVWFYSPKELRRILQLGVYAYGEIYNRTTFGRQIVDLYRRKLRAKRRRRKRSGPQT